MRSVSSRADYFINSVSYAIIDVSTRYYVIKEQETPNFICLQRRQGEGRKERSSFKEEMIVVRRGYEFIPKDKGKV